MRLALIAALPAAALAACISLPASDPTPVVVQQRTDPPVVVHRHYHSGSPPAGVVYREPRVVYREPLLVYREDTYTDPYIRYRLERRYRDSRNPIYSP
jgi:hypothetical protein